MGLDPILKRFQLFCTIFGTITAFIHRMTIPASLEAATSGLDVTGAQRSLNSGQGGLRASTEPGQSFGERWQALFDINKMASKLAETPSAREHQSLSTEKVDESGLRNRHAASGKSSQRKAIATPQEAQLGLIEVNSAAHQFAPTQVSPSFTPENNDPVPGADVQQKTTVESILPTGTRHFQAGDLAEMAPQVVLSNGPQATAAAASLSAQQLEKPSAVVSSKLTSTPVTTSETGRDTSVDKAADAPELGTSGIQALRANAIEHDSVPTHLNPLPIQSVAKPFVPASPDQGKVETGEATGTDSQLQAPKALASHAASMPSERMGSNQSASNHASPSSSGHLAPQLSGQFQMLPSRDLPTVYPVSNQAQSASFPSQALSSTTPQVNVHETFAALDAGDNTAATRWIHAGRNTAEAGFEDPALGWVGVRAQVGPGGVHATVVPVSADAAQALSTHFSGLSAYLSQHRTPVETLTMGAAEGQLGQHSMDQRGGHSTGQGTNQDGRSSQANEGGRSVVQVPQHSVASVQDSGAALPAPHAHQGGTHISVLA